MKTAVSWFAVLAAALFAGCSTTSTTAPHRDFSGMPPTDITVTVSCSDPTMKFAGTITADGQLRRVSGKGSGAFRVTGHEFSAFIKKARSEGQITVVVAQSNQSLGSATAFGPFGAHFEVLRTPTEQHDLFTTF